MIQVGHRSLQNHGDHIVDVCRECKAAFPQKHTAATICSTCIGPHTTQEVQQDRRLNHSTLAIMQTRHVQDRCNSEALAYASKKACQYCSSNANSFSALAFRPPIGNLIPRRTLPPETHFHGQDSRSTLTPALRQHANLRLSLEAGLLR